MRLYQVGRSDFALLLANQLAILNFQIAYAAAVTGYNKALLEIEFLAGNDSSQKTSMLGGNVP